jgi:MoxR-like ATPase
MNPTEIKSDSARVGYIADDELCTTLHLMQQLSRPLLVEGEAGVGKTAIAKVLSEVLGRALVRLQCYEGLDANAAVYEWNYSHQLLSIKQQEHEPSSSNADTDIFAERFLLERPLLQAIRSPDPTVLLIDEVDRADEAFEAFLLELLSDYQITIPELGTITATSIPLVVLTSNGTRELSDALRRRCLYHYLDYPDASKELKILKTRQPDVDETLANQVVQFVQRLRQEELRKPPGIAETLDWVSALISMDVTTLTDDPSVILSTRACLLKTRDDVGRIGPTLIDELLSPGP